MKKTSNTFLTAVLGMGTGAFLYAYCQKHPIKLWMAKNKVMDIVDNIKDYK